MCGPVWLDSQVITDGVQKAARSGFGHDFTTFQAKGLNFILYAMAEPGEVFCIYYF